MACPPGGMAFKGHYCLSSQDTFGSSLLSYMQEQDKIMLQSGLLVPIQELNFISCLGGCFPQVQMGSEPSLQEEESGKVAPPSEPLPHWPASLLAHMEILGRSGV